MIVHELIGLQHVLVVQIAERELRRVAIDCHHRDDLQRILIERKFALDLDLYGSAGLANAAYTFAQPWSLGFGMTRRSTFLTDFVITHSMTMRGAGLAILSVDSADQMVLAMPM